MPASPSATPSSNVNPIVQTDLDLSDAEPGASSFPLAVFRAPDQPGAITGFALRMGEDGPLLQFRWRRPRRYEPQTPMALSGFGDTELAAVQVDDLELGHATPMEVLRALVDDAPWRRERASDGDVRAVRALLDGAPARREPPIDVDLLLGADALTLCSPAERERRRRGLLATLAGCATPVVELLGRQGLLEAAWAPGFDWRHAVAEHRRLAAEGGREAFLLLALVPPRRLPAKGLASRLAHVDEPALTAAFVRAAAGVRGERERARFEETLETALKHLMLRWRDTTADPSAPVVARAVAHLMSMAERVAFAAALVDARTALPPADARVAFTLPAKYAALRRPAHRPQDGEAVRPALLHAWALRCAHEFARAALASPLLMEGFRRQCNEALDAVAAGHWSCDDLRQVPWRQLVRPDWRAEGPVPPALPQAHWPCELPQGAQPMLREAGLELRPIACTRDLLAEAAEMDNCLASSTGYFDELLAGRTRIFAISGAGLRATLQLTHGEDGWFPEQIRGPGNHPFEDDLARSPQAPWPALRAFVANYRALPRARACPAPARPLPGTQGSARARPRRNRCAPAARDAPAPPPWHAGDPHRAPARDA